MRSFFITAKGYIGIGPSGTYGDCRVCVLSGAELPFVLNSSHIRTYYSAIDYFESSGSEAGEIDEPSGVVEVEDMEPMFQTDTETEDFDPSFRVLGECYVHGMMDGEVRRAFSSTEVCRFRLVWSILVGAWRGSGSAEARGRDTKQE